MSTLIQSQAPSESEEADCPKKVWKMDLYKLQMEAPRPILFPRDKHKEIKDSPDYYSMEYHGVLGHKQVEQMFKDEVDGVFLVRMSPSRGSEIPNKSEFYTLSMKFDGKPHHFKLYFNPFLGHYVQEDTKTFEKIEDLVADGLLSMYMKKHAKPILDQIMNQNESEYQQSPYMTLNRRKLRALSTELKIGHNTRKRDEDESKRITVALIQHERIKESEQRPEEPLPPEYKKTHNFKVHNFKGLNWCELCANFLWGFSAQGVKCEDCGFVAHQKCSEKVPPKCVPDLKKVRGVFGIDLTTLVIAHKQEIPFVVEKCVKEIEKRGLLQEGIYRISGFADEIEQVKETLDKEGNTADMSEKRVNNINVVASILKMYLRLLPIPLITFQAYPGLIEASSEFLNANLNPFKFL